PYATLLRSRGHRLGVRVVVLERDLDRDAFALAREHHGLRVQNLLVLVQVLHELQDAALVEERLALAAARIGQLDREAAVEERELAHAAGERVVVEVRLLEDRGIRQEARGGPRALHSLL